MQSVRPVDQYLQWPLSIHGNDLKDFGRDCTLTMQAHFSVECFHSKWIDVIPAHAATSSATIEKVRVVFATHGLPERIVTGKYRITPHTTTGQSPAELLLGRQPRSQLATWTLVYRFERVRQDRVMDMTNIQEPEHFRLEIMYIAEFCRSSYMAGRNRIGNDWTCIILDLTGRWLHL